MTPKELSESQQVLGFSIDEMSSAMNVHRSTWNKWTRGERKPSNAAVQLVRLMLWLHTKCPVTLTRWLKER